MMEDEGECMKERSGELILFMLSQFRCPAQAREGKRKEWQEGKEGGGHGGETTRKRREDAL